VSPHGFIARLMLGSKALVMSLQSRRGLLLADMCLVVTTTQNISPALLGRARALFSEHDGLSKQLLNAFDVKTAQKVGALSEVVKALKEWDLANNVCQGHCYDLL